MKQEKLTAAQKKVLAKWVGNPYAAHFAITHYFKGTKELPKSLLDNSIFTHNKLLDCYCPNMKNELVKEYFSSFSFEKLVNVDTPEMTKPIIKKPFCETVNDAVNFSKPNYTLCDKFKLAFIGHVKSNPTATQSSKFLKDIEPVIPRLQSESYLILLKESLK